MLANELPGDYLDAIMTTMNPTDSAGWSRSRRRARLGRGIGFFIFTKHLIFTYVQDEPHRFSKDFADHNA